MRGIRLKLIDEWRSFWKLWSVRFNTAGTFLLGWLVLAPDYLITGWSLLPEDVKAFIPVQYMGHIALVLFVLGLISRAIKQSKIHKEEVK
jgi:hypothetical protein